MMNQAVTLQDDHMNVFAAATPLNGTIVTGKKPAFREVLACWLKLGFTSFGEQRQQIAAMHAFLVEEKKWISQSRFEHVTQRVTSLPGPGSLQMAVYLGWLLHGLRGGLAAGLAFVLPSLLFMAALCTIYVTAGAAPWVTSLFHAVRPAVVAVLVIVLLRIGRRSLITSFHWIIAQLSFAAIFFLNIPFPFIILGAFVLTWLIKQVKPRWFKEEEMDRITSVDESNYFLNIHQLLPEGVQGDGTLWRRLLIVAGLCLIPAAALFLFTENTAFWQSVVRVFGGASAVTFGGAYGVLPYLMQAGSQQGNWFSETQLLDGLAISELTPGPLAVVLPFAGFMAGYHTYWAGSLLMGIAGLLTAAYYTFLPWFAIVFVAGPHLENSPFLEKIRPVLCGVLAAITGILIHFLLYAGRAVLFPQSISLWTADWFAAIWLVLSLVVLLRLKVNKIVWIGISALAGLGHYLLF